MMGKAAVGVEAPCNPHLATRLVYTLRLGLSRAAPQCTPKPVQTLRLGLSRAAPQCTPKPVQTLRLGLSRAAPQCTPKPVQTAFSIQLEKHWPDGATYWPTCRSLRIAKHPWCCVGIQQVLAVNWFGVCRWLSAALLKENSSSKNTQHPFFI